ncbi:MAG: TetR family transcriptional regulator [Solirubrobacterales bacterium]|nr:TetR family transcriptional regulator [Solirubrobacterales bacterium]
MTQRETDQSTRTPRTGRRPGASSTREEIIAAARQLFAQRGYDGATMRAIAGEAGVDAALIVHFFGNKPTLLGEAVQWPFDPDVEIPKLLADGRRNVGRRMAELFVRTWDDEGDRNPILTLLRAGMTEPQAAEMLGGSLRLCLFGPLLERLGSDRPDLRANLVASQLVGMGTVRYVLGFEPVASARPADVVAWLAPTLQRYLTGKLER